MCCTMLSYEVLIEISFGISFVANLIISLVVFGRLTSDKKPVIRDLNSPGYLGALLLGFLGGILSDTFLAAFSDIRVQGSLSWFWPWIALEFLLGSAIIGIILYFLFRGSMETT